MQCPLGAADARLDALRLPVLPWETRAFARKTAGCRPDLRYAPFRRCQDAPSGGEDDFDAERTRERWTPAVLACSYGRAEPGPTRFRISQRPGPDRVRD